VVRTPSSDGAVANTTAVVRVMNERAVYEQTRALGPVSAAQLVSATGLSKPTIGLALGNLERTGLVRHVGHRIGQVGRAPRLYEIRPEAGFALAVDVGGSWLRAAVGDLSGRVVAQGEERVRARTATSLVRQLGELVRAVPQTGGLAFDDITHTVIGIPGVYEPAAGRISIAPNLPGWDKPGSVEALRAQLGDDFSIENDVNLAALAEQEHGLGEKVRDFVFVSVGTGVGMGVVINGELYRGFTGRAGEIAYLPVGDHGPDGPEVPSSADTRRHGILETVASAEGIVATARHCGMTVDSAERVFAAARAGEVAAVRAVRIEADHLARALTAIVSVLDPSLIVLGGGVGGNVDLLLEPTQARLGELMGLTPPPIRGSALGRDNVVLGGLAAGLQVARDAVLARSHA
jgi:predicted NBD/HSP70 family sugar kinase